jgi:methylaspartate mutase epsilon subunit
MNISFHDYVSGAARAGRLVVQPRMGFGTISAMSEGLYRVRDAVGLEPRAGTLTIDAMTRVNQVGRATEILKQGKALNGFPIVSHGPQLTRQMLAAVSAPNFAVQVRHGSAFPMHIFETAAAAGFDAIEGGPVSYNFPYSRHPLADTIAAWREACRFWAAHGQRFGVPTHIETFAGCMMGQMAPPELLVALSLLEGMFLEENGIASVSLSLAQGSLARQDEGALMALGALAKDHLRRSDWHLVFYTYMGVFPRSVEGAERLIRDSAETAVRGRAHRLIVKTVAEAHGIPTIENNIEALSWARESADKAANESSPETKVWAQTIFDRAEKIIVCVRSLGSNIGDALGVAFAGGILDVPYCIHQSNRNEAKATVDPASGAVVWINQGRIPIERAAVRRDLADRFDGQAYKNALAWVRDRYDGHAREVAHANG